MSVSRNVRYIEYDEIIIDLRCVSYSVDRESHQNNSQYIVFLNAKKIFYTNYVLTTDMSLETLTMYIVERVIYMENKQRIPIMNNVYKKIQYNEMDKNCSLIVNLSENARIVIARTIKPGERYAQRIGGYIDFEHRHNVAYVPEKCPIKRAKMDREREICLLNVT